MEIFISTEMQNMEHLLACLGQKTMMLLLPTEQCSQSVAYPFSLVLIQKCLTNIYQKPRCYSIYAKKMLRHHCPSRLRLSTHSHKDTGSFLHVPSPSSEATHGEIISSDNKKPRGKGSCETCCINESCCWYYPHWWNNCIKLSRAVHMTGWVN